MNLIKKRNKTGLRADQSLLLSVSVSVYILSLVASGASYLLMCSTYLSLHEDMLCALSLPSNINGTELFKSLNEYISGKLDWSFCIGTDRAAG